MAKKEEGPKIVLEREYNVPLRRAFMRVSRWKKTNRAVKALREFLVKHMKPLDADPKNVKIGKYANLDMWKHGIKNPPHHIKVIAKKDDKGIVTAEIIGAPEEKTKEKGKKATPATSEKKEDKAGKKETAEKTKEEKAPEKPKETPEEKPAEKETKKEEKEVTKEKSAETKPAEPQNE